MLQSFANLMVHAVSVTSHMSSLTRRMQQRPDSEDSSDVSPPHRGRRRSSSASSTPETVTQTQNANTTTSTLAKKLVRYAISCEYSRTPIRRADISTKVLGEAGLRQFKLVFASAQAELASKFGMSMQELPGREKTGLKERRKAAESQKVTTGSSGSKSWILVSVLPKSYKESVEICPPGKAPSQASEATYTALYTFILSLIYLNNGSLPENKLDRYLKRANADTYTPGLSTEKLLVKMLKEGYVEKRRDTSTGEEIIEWVVGPRGKVEVGISGVQGLVRRVYGATGEDGESALGEEQGEELESKLRRSLGVSNNNDQRTVVEGTDGDNRANGEEGAAGVPGSRQRAGRWPQRDAAAGDDGEDDE